MGMRQNYLCSILVLFVIINITKCEARLTKDLKDKYKCRSLAEKLQMQMNQKEIESLPASRILNANADRNLWWRPTSLLFRRRYKYKSRMIRRKKFSKRYTPKIVRRMIRRAKKAKRIYRKYRVIVYRLKKANKPKRVIIRYKRKLYRYKKRALKAKKNAKKALKKKIIKVSKKTLKKLNKKVRKVNKMIKKAKLAKKAVKKLLKAKKPKIIIKKAEKKAKKL